MRSIRKGFHLFSLKGVSILDQLCFEELLLRTTEQNCVVVNSHINSNSIVLGFSGKPLELLNIAKVKRDNLQVIRRFTGGGTVIVDTDTVFASLIMNSSSVACPPYPREIMKWTEDNVYQPVFQELMDADPTHSGSNQFALLENDYVWGDRKIGGNAQTITKGRWVHHTSFLWKFDPFRMGYLKLPSKRPAYRADRAHQDFLTEISPYLPLTRRDPAHFHQAIDTQMAAFFAAQPAEQLQQQEGGVEKPTDKILAEFAQGSSSEVMGDAEFQALYAALRAANPQYEPRTYIVDDLPSEPDSV